MEYSNRSKKLRSFKINYFSLLFIKRWPHSPHSSYFFSPPLPNDIHQVLLVLSQLKLVFVSIIDFVLLDWSEYNFFQYGNWFQQGCLLEHWCEYFLTLHSSRVFQSVLLFWHLEINHHRYHSFCCFPHRGIL